VLHSEGDDLSGGLVLGLLDAAAMARLGTTQADSVAVPTPRPALPTLRRTPGSSGLPGLLILKVQVVLGAERPSRHQQPHLLGHNGIGVDDPKVDSRHPARVYIVLFLGNDGCDCHP
jgi:hypothetical protein